jgi:hypothetical protein
VGGEGVGAVVVDEVVVAVGVAPEVEAGEGLADLPVAEDLNAVVGFVADGEILD